MTLLMASLSRIVLAGLILFVLILSTAPTRVNAIAEQKAISIPIKVVLVGLDQVDTNYIGWRSGSSGNLPEQITNQVILGNSTGEIFHPNYTVIKAFGGFKQELESYLGSIGNNGYAPDPWFGKYVTETANPDYCDWQNVSLNYVTYDANSVESWMWNHQQEVGGFSPNGWTIILSYLPELPSINWKDIQNFESTKYNNLITMPASNPHYYSVSSVDPDLGYRLRYRDFMNAWGGKQGRMWYVDLSAGPVYNSQWDDIPLQVAIGDNKIDLSSPFGQQWLEEYVSDYVSQATVNFITPDFVYYPYYRPNYQIDAFIIDDRNAAEKSAVPIESTVNKQLILSAYQDLVPYSSVSVNVSFLDVSQDLDQTIRSAYKYTDSWLKGNQFCAPERYGVVDVRPVYKYMLDHLTSYEKNPFLTHDTMTIPAFAFAFSNQTYFTDSYKWYIGKTDPENGALLGVALDQAAFISYNQYEFTRGDQVSPHQPGKGEGFTQTIIHEVGHEFGLMHPHEFGDIGDFIYSPMGYFTNDYTFGQIDKDAVQRAHVDQVYFATQDIMGQLPADAASQVQTALMKVDSSYSAMNYVDAMHAVLSAYQLAQQLQGSNPTGQSMPGETAPTSISTTLGVGQPSVLYIGVGVGIGIVVGMSIAIFAHSRREKQPKSSTTRMYDEPSGGVFCIECGTELPLGSKFCKKCGAKQS